MKKWIIRLAILGVILFVAVIVTLSLNLNRLVKHAIETVGPEVTKVDVGVGSVVLLPLSGKGRVGGLHVGNPSGYSTPNAIKVGGAAVSIDTGTIMDEKIVIRSINIDNPEITLEGSLKQNNLTKILDNVNAYVAKNSSPSSGSKSGSEAGKEASKALQIDSVSITGAKVNLAIPLLKGKSVNVPLQDIHLSNLGQGPEGVTAAEVSSQVMDQLLDQIAVLVPQFLASGALGDLGLDLAKAAGELGIDAAKLGIGLGKTGADGIGKGAESITKGVGGLLKGLKKD